ncbi:MAG: GNAT family N-acetyltransferase [Spirochaetes bacterium]|nr:GNAT family N-acetyltransferase [Spirochaetota bacterium]
MTIRDFLPADAPDISALIIKNLRDVNSKDYPHDTIERLVDRFTPENIIGESSWRHIIVAEDNRTVIGTASIGKKTIDNTADRFVLTVFVHPAFHGRDVGTLLMREIERIAAKWCTHMLVVPASITAKSFYLKLGYRFHDGREQVTEHGTYTMTKVISHEACT